MSRLETSIDFNNYILQPQNLEFYILNYFVANSKIIQNKINKHFSSELILNLIKLIKFHLLKYESIHQIDIKPSKNIKNKHLEFLIQAKREANKSNLTQKHGCVIVYNNKIIAKGYNSICNFDKMKSIHAEIDALNYLNRIFKLKDKKLRKKCNLYVVRIKKCDDTLKMSKPCNNCASKIVKSNIGTVYYSVNNNFIDDVICEHVQNII